VQKLKDINKGNWGGRRETTAFFTELQEKKILHCVRGTGGKVDRDYWNYITTKHLQEYILKYHFKKVSEDYVLKLFKKYNWIKVKKNNKIYWKRPPAPEPKVKRAKYRTEEKLLDLIYKLKDLMYMEYDKVVTDEQAKKFFQNPNWKKNISEVNYYVYFEDLEEDE